MKISRGATVRVWPHDLFTLSFHSSSSGAGLRASPEGLVSSSPVSTFLQQEGQQQLLWGPQPVAPLARWGGGCPQVLLQRDEGQYSGKHTMQWEMQQITSRQAGEVNTIPWTCPSCAAEGRAPTAGHGRPVWMRNLEFDPEQMSLTRSQTVEHWKDVYQNHSKAVWWWKPAGIIETGGEKGKTRRGLCPLYLLGLIGSRCIWWSRSEWSLRRQKAEHRKPSPLTQPWNKQGRAVTQPLS